MTSGDAYNLACPSDPPGSNCPAAKGSDLDFGSSAILVNLPNRKRALIGAQKSGVVTAVDPDRAGAILWQTRVGRGGPFGGVQWGSAADGDKIYVSTLRFPTPNLALSRQLHPEPSRRPSTRKWPGCWTARLAAAYTH